MKRPARLQSARSWLVSFNGKNVVRSYAKWFAVDYRCAMTELGMLDVYIDPKLIPAFDTPKRPETKKADPYALPEGCGVDWDDNYSYIAGFTSGGAPFGIPWDDDE